MKDVRLVAAAIAGSVSKSSRCATAADENSSDRLPKSASQSNLGKQANCGTLVQVARAERP